MIDSRWTIWKRRAAAGLLASIGGCAADPLGPLPLTWRTNVAEKRWHQANLENYSFYSSVSCFCSPEYASRKAVQVRNGAVVSVRDEPSGVARPLTFRQPIDSLFALLRRETVSGRVQEVEFDERLGFPTRMAFGSDALDDGALIVVEELQPAVVIRPARPADGGPYARE